MKIQVRRKWFTGNSTIGELYIDGTFFCFTLEDPTRSGEKVYGNTAIPVGTYRLEVTWSPRFKRNMAQVMDVPGFEGIRIHSGNSAKDTEGCLLLGQSKATDFVGGSKAAVTEFEKRIDGVKDITIEYLEERNG